MSFRSDFISQWESKPPDQVPGWVQTLLEKYKKEESDAQRYRETLSQGVPTAQIDQRVPGLEAPGQAQSDASFMDRMMRVGAGSAGSRAGGGAPYNPSTVTGGLTQVAEGAAQTSDLANAALPAINPVAFALKKALPQMPGDRQAQDLREQLRNASEAASSAHPTPLGIAGDFALQSIAPAPPVLEALSPLVRPIGRLGTKALDKIAETPLAGVEKVLRSDIALPKGVLRSAVRDVHLKTEPVARAIEAETLDLRYELRSKTEDVLRNLPDADKERVKDLLVQSTNYRDLDAQEELARISPDLAETAGRMRESLDSLAELASKAHGKEYVPGRHPSVVSADTDPNFANRLEASIAAGKKPQAFEEAVQFHSRMTGLPPEVSSSTLLSKARTAPEGELPRNFDGLKWQTLADAAGRDVREQLFMDAQGEATHLASYKRALETAGVRDADGFLEGLADPTSRVAMSRKRTEDTIAAMAEELRFIDPAAHANLLAKSETAKSYALLKAYGESNDAVTNATSAVKAYATQIKRAQVAPALRDALQPFVKKSEELPANARDWVRIDSSSKAWGEEFAGLDGMHMPAGLAKVARAAVRDEPVNAAARGLLNVGRWLNSNPLVKALKLPILSGNSQLQLMNAANSATISLLGDVRRGLPTKVGSAARAGFMSIARAARKELTVDTNAAIGKQIDRLKFTRPAAQDDSLLKLFPWVKNLGRDTYAIFTEHSGASHFESGLGQDLAKAGVSMASRGTKPTAVDLLGRAYVSTEKTLSKGMLTGDELFRGATFWSNVANAEKIHGVPKTADEANNLLRIAGDATKATFPTAERAWEPLRQASKVVPFTAYHADSLRVMVDTLRLGAKEIADGVAGRVKNPAASISSGVSRMTGTIGAAGLTTVLYALRSKKDEAKNAAMADQNYGDPGKTVLDLGTTAEGKERSFPLSRALPFEQWVGQTIIATARAYNGEKPPSAESVISALGAGAEELGSSWLNVSPLVSYGVEMATGEDRYGRRWREKATDAQSAAKAVAQSAARTVERTVPGLPVGILTGTRSENPMTTRPYPYVKDVDVDRQAQYYLSDAKDKLVEAYTHRDPAKFERAAADIRDQLEKFSARGQSYDDLQAQLKRVMTSYPQLYAAFIERQSMPEYVPRNRR